jgi:acetyl-CoA synthetase
MDLLVNKFVKTDFSSYKDFKENLKINIPENFNFAFDVLDELAEKTPDKKAMVWCDENGAHQDFTFGDLKKSSARAANFFKSLGIKKGDAVMLILKRRHEYWACVNALHKIGAIGIPATHLLTVKDIKYRVQAADIKMIVCAADERITKTIDEAQTNVIKVIVNGLKQGWASYAEAEKCSDVFKRPTGADATKNSDPFLLYFTSGTTGMPKMVWHDYTYPLGHIITAKFWQNLHPGSLHLTVADTGWAKASWGKLYGQWICETCVFTYDFERFVAKNLLEVMGKYGVTSFCAPPTVYRHLIKEDFSKYDLSKLEYAETAGEPLNPEVFNQFQRLTNLQIKEGFGQTETITIIATFPWVTPRPGALGKPAAGWDLDIIDDNQKPCEAGQEGHLVAYTKNAKPLGLFGGYWQDKELTEKTWHGGIYYTGDMAYKDEDGYFWFVGRSDDVIKSSGYRIGPFEVESALIEHPAVLECAITAVPDEERGAVVKATVILCKGYTASDNLAKELQNHVKKVTAPYKYPRIIEFVEELPKTISGKIRRVEIRETDKNK